MSRILNEVQTKIRLWHRIHNNNSEIITLQQEIEYWKNQDKSNKDRITALETKWAYKESSERRINLLLLGCLESSDDHPKKGAADLFAYLGLSFSEHMNLKPALLFTDLIVKIAAGTNSPDLL